MPFQGLEQTTSSTGGFDIAEAIDIKIVFADHRHPCCLQRRIFNKDSGFGVQFSKNVAFLQPFGNLFSFCFHARMGLLAADDAAQVFLVDILRH